MAKKCNITHSTLVDTGHLYRSVQIKCPAQNGQPVLDGGIMHASLVETVHGQFLLFLQLLQEPVGYPIVRDKMVCRH